MIFLQNYNKIPASMFLCDNKSWHRLLHGSFQGRFLLKTKSFSFELAI